MVSALTICSNGTPAFKPKIVHFHQVSAIVWSKSSQTRVSDRRADLTIPFHLLTCPTQTVLSIPATVHLWIMPPHPAAPSPPAPVSRGSTATTAAHTNAPTSPATSRSRPPICKAGTPGSAPTATPASTPTWAMGIDGPCASVSEEDSHPQLLRLYPRRRRRRRRRRSHPPAWLQLNPAPSPPAPGSTPCRPVTRAPASNPSLASRSVSCMLGTLPLALIAGISGSGMLIAWLPRDGTEP